MTARIIHLRTPAEDRRLADVRRSLLWGARDARRMGPFAKTRDDVTPPVAASGVTNTNHSNLNEKTR